jgi:hypothetical protein
MDIIAEVYFPWKMIIKTIKIERTEENFRL